MSMFNHSYDNLNDTSNCDINIGVDNSDHAQAATSKPSRLIEFSNDSSMLDINMWDNYFYCAPKQDTFECEKLCDVFDAEWCNPFSAKKTKPNKMDLSKFEPVTISKLCSELWHDDPTPRRTNFNPQTMTHKKYVKNTPGKASKENIFKKPSTNSKLKVPVVYSAPGSRRSTRSNKLLENKGNTPKILVSHTKNNNNPKVQSNAFYTPRPNTANVSGQQRTEMKHTKPPKAIEKAQAVNKTVPPAQGCSSCTKVEDKLTLILQKLEELHLKTEKNQTEICTIKTSISTITEMTEKFIEFYSKPNSNPPEIKIVNIESTKTQTNQNSKEEKCTNVNEAKLIPEATSLEYFSCQSSVIVTQNDESHCPINVSTQETKIELISSPSTSKSVDIDVDNDLSTMITKSPVSLDIGTKTALSNSKLGVSEELGAITEIHQNKNYSNQLLVNDVTEESGDNKENNDPVEHHVNRRLFGLDSITECNTPESEGIEEFDESIVQTPFKPKSIKWLLSVNSDSDNDSKSLTETPSGIIGNATVSEKFDTPDAFSKTIISYNKLKGNSFLCTPKHVDNYAHLMTPSALKNNNKLVSRKIQQQLYLLNDTVKTAEKEPQSTE